MRKQRRGAAGGPAATADASIERELLLSQAARSRGENLNVGGEGEMDDSIEKAMAPNCFACGEILKRDQVSYCRICEWVFCTSCT